MSSTHDDMKRFLVPQCKWDSKASPFGFWLFLGAIGAVVRTSTHWSGHLLEEFLDAKLKRAKVKKSSVPSYILEDPDFARPPGPTGRPSLRPAEGDGTGESEEADSSGGAKSSATTISEGVDTSLSGEAGDAAAAELAARQFAAAARSVTFGAKSGATGGHFSLAPASTSYWDLPEKTLEFDGLMYNVLKLNITGPAAALLEHTQIPSYVQAIIILTKHYNLSRLQRVQAAFEVIDKINYSGDPMAFQVSFMAAKRCRSS